MSEVITCNADIIKMLDGLLKEQSRFNWDTFYAERSRAVPFFMNAPDENLVAYFEGNVIPRSGKVLDLGCGPGRNALYFAKRGYEVDAVDLSAEGLKWGEERAVVKGVNVNFIQENIFDLHIPPETYDIIYDSGCFHHIAPHRRIDYVNLLKHCLKPDGFFGLTCFVENGVLGGADLSDWEVYRQRSLKGGLGYTPEKLKVIFQDFQIIEMRRMKDMDTSNKCFGVSGLWTALFQKT